jgi:hypothetical protein
MQLKIGERGIERGKLPGGCQQVEELTPEREVVRIHGNGPFKDRPRIGNALFPAASFDLPSGRVKEQSPETPPLQQQPMVKRDTLREAEGAK